MRLWPGWKRAKEQPVEVSVPEHSPELSRFLKFRRAQELVWAFEEGARLWREAERRGWKEDAGPVIEHVNKMAERVAEIQSPGYMPKIRGKIIEKR